MTWVKLVPTRGVKIRTLLICGLLVLHLMKAAHGLPSKKGGSQQYVRPVRRNITDQKGSSKHVEIVNVPGPVAVVIVGAMGVTDDKNDTATATVAAVTSGGG